MKKFLGSAFFFMCAIPSFAQTPVMQQHCYSQACLFSSWQPNKEGDLLVAVIRTSLKAPLPCESNPAGCGDGLYLVSDLNNNHWRRAYSTLWTSEFWYALDAKPGNNIVGVMASYGYDYPDGGVHGGGDFNFDVFIAEFPPAIGLEAATRSNDFMGAGNGNPSAPSVTTTSSKTLLIGWTNNLAVNFGKGPLSMTPDSPDFHVITDDGFLAVATSLASSRGSTHTFSAGYNGNALWSAGLVAFKMR